MKSFTAALIFFMIVSPAGKKELTDNEYVRVELQSPDTLPLSKSGTISFQFTPVEGIHVNTNPEIEFVLEKNSAFTVSGKPGFKKNKTGYLETSKPVTVSFSAKEGAKPGRQLLKGSLRYFFCSDKDGWCNRHAQPVEMTIELTK